jgi:AmmeMemoRadiSam system protein A
MVATVYPAVDGANRAGVAGVVGTTVDRTGTASATVSSAGAENTDDYNAANNGMDGDRVDGGDQVKTNKNAKALLSDTDQETERQMKTRGESQENTPGEAEATTNAAVPVELAKLSLSSFFKLGCAVDPPENIPAEFLNKRAGAFVCLKKNGNLRGCIGTIQPVYANLAEEIMANTIQAAMADPRFDPVNAAELPHLTYSVDVLEEPEPIDTKELLNPKVYGVIVRSGYKAGLLLPDIDGVDTVDDQIEIARRKAGIGRFEDMELYRFEVIRYE